VVARATVITDTQANEGVRPYEVSYVWKHRVLPYKIEPFIAMRCDSSSTLGQHLNFVISTEGRNLCFILWSL